MFKLMAVVVVAVVLMLAPVAVADVTGDANYNSPNGHAEGFVDFLNEQDCVAHNHEIYVDEGRDSVEAYLGIEYLPTKSIVLGARALSDVNNDWDMRYEAGCTFRFGPGSE